ncbi:hypothetical protein H0901_05190 [Microcystis aeruginosa BLCCF158]|uniref:Uncharacterized protein n=1 Tax=Microcystis aeruginosa BLCC-F158 TaxID=2755316 RepID=A0A841UXE8_MICAE|nr:hypothetical protein [Microcystis aeruginosa]MBC1194695.1 hypothetical protein [Microcystis aeruginosa BLCC-F158]
MTRVLSVISYQLSVISYQPSVVRKLEVRSSEMTFYLFSLSPHWPLATDYCLLITGRLRRAFGNTDASPSLVWTVRLK